LGSHTPVFETSPREPTPESALERHLTEQLTELRREKKDVAEQLEFLETKRGAKTLL